MLTDRYMVKFDQDGQAIPYYGNTIVSMLSPTQTDTADKVALVQEKLLQSSFSHCLAALPKSSFHMTIIPLCREIDRGTKWWPNYIKANAKFSEIDLLVKEKVDMVKIPTNITMEVDYIDINKIVLKSANEQTEQNLRNYRDNIADVVGICHDKHYEYRFHITMNYVYKELTNEQMEEAKVLCRFLGEKLKESLGVFTVPAPSFTIFNNMLSYYNDLSRRGEIF